MVTRNTAITIQYFINSVFLIWGAWKISVGDVKNGLYLIVGFFILCLLSYVLWREKKDKPLDGEQDE